jgi:hypothetical protein
LHFAHGGEADFRGEDGAIYNILTHTNISMNALWEMSAFLLPLHWGGMKVRGSFVTDVYITARTNVTGTELRIEYSPNQPPTPIVHGLPGVSALRLNAGDAKRLEDVSVALETRAGGQGGEAEVLKVTTSGWRIEASARLIWRSTSPGKKQIDLSFSPVRDPLAALSATGKVVAPHGLIGQSYDGDSIAIDGKQDHYKQLWKAQGSGHEIVTTAQAEGAIEGDGKEYKMDHFFATDFKYSRFSIAEAAPRDISNLGGVKRKVERNPSVWNVAAGTMGDDEREDQNNAPAPRA